MTQTISQLIYKSILQIDRFDAELLLAHTLQKPREFIITYPEHKVSFFQKYKFLNLVKKRASGIPIAYLTGHKEFFGLDFLVNKYTLVPRPDTEILVESVLKEIDDTLSFRPKRSEVEESQQNNTVIIDIGTGSGCIPISIAKNIQQKNIHIFATDISSRALKIAKRNAQLHNVQINFLPGDLLEAITTKDTSFENKNIILTANLPYLTQTQFDTESSIQHEPHNALAPDDHGLALYKQLLTQIQQHNITGPFFFEIDPSQSQILSEYITKIFPDSKIQIIKDLCGRDRVIKIQIYFRNLFFK